LDFDEQFFSSVVDAAPDGILIVDRDGTIVFTNRQVSALFGYGSDELVGLSVDALLPDNLRAGHRAHRTHYQADPQVRPMGLDMKLKARRKDGNEFPVEISLSPVSAGDETFVVAAVRDITARVDAEERLRQSQSALLEAEQVLAVADDRERIARDLHDTVIQRLFAAGLSLQATASRTDEGVRDRIENIVDDLDQTIRDVRTAVFSLQSSRPSERGLRGLLLDVTSDARTTIGFEPRVQFDGPVESIDESVAEHLVPVLREALSNVAKHAKASEVRVSVAVGSNVELTVADNGVGVPDAVFGGNGLDNLRSRAESMGGHCEVTPRNGGGSVVHWSVPVSPLEAEPAVDPDHRSSNATH
jgi:PAS domain S-box-containing protein